MSAIVPIPRVALSIREATIDDLSFIDALQKKHGKMVGFLQTKALEAKIAAKQIIIAEDELKQRVGYCIGQDQYFKRDDVGIIYQMNVVPQQQRGLIGATLVKAMFDRAAYGCKLFCCWCAQDIEANYFWESLGFVPLAFRAGSRGKCRVHIFWQRRIREGDTTTPYWFPSKTSAGAIGEDRLAFPIPPGTHWSDAKPIILPGETAQKQLADVTRKKSKKPAKPAAPAFDKYDIGSGGLRAVTIAATVAQAQVKSEPKPKRVKAKHDPKMVSAARELRDRWLEQVNSDPSLLLPVGKYAVARQLAAPTPKATQLLIAA